MKIYSKLKADNKPFIFIHIGKCGGSTITNILRNHNIKFDRVHVARPQYQSDKKYLISLRNPVERFVSAFYWRKRLVSTKQKDRFYGEYNFFQKFTTIEDVINNDITTLRKNYVHHIKEDISFYLGDFVNQCDPTNVIGIVCTENLNKDIENIFDIKARGVHINNNKKNKKELQEKYRESLKKYLYKDYLIIEKLNNLKLLTREQYGILSR
jgi:hypothetical protein